MEKMRPKINFHKKNKFRRSQKRICDMGREISKSYEISYEDHMISGEFKRCCFDLGKKERI